MGLNVPHGPMPNSASEGPAIIPPADDNDGSAAREWQHFYFARSRASTQHPIPRRRQIRRRPVHLGNWFRPLPDANRSMFSSDKQPILIHFGPPDLREHGISDASFYYWCKKYGGLDVSESTRVKAFEGERARTKKLLPNRRWTTRRPSCLEKGLTPGASRNAVSLVGQ